MTWGGSVRRASCYLLRSLLVALTWKPYLGAPLQGCPHAGADGLLFRHSQCSLRLRPTCAQDCEEQLCPGQCFPRGW